MRVLSSLLACVWGGLGFLAHGQEVMRLQGSPVVAAIMSVAAPDLRELGIDIKINTEGGSSSGAQGLGFETADIGMATKSIGPDVRAQFPDKEFQERQIGVQAVAVLVSRDVWDSGIRTIARDQLRDIYEGRVTNWKQLGGEDRPIKFFNGERGRGVWEFFAVWIYGDLKKAPLGSQFETIVNGEDARNTVEFNAGSISFAAPRWADNKTVYALAVKDESGTAIEPTPVNFASKKYPLVRPLTLVFVERPLGTRKKVLEFVMSEKGQAIIRRIDLIPMADLPPAEGAR